MKHKYNLGTFIAKGTHAFGISRRMLQYVAMMCCLVAFVPVKQVAAQGVILDSIHIDQQISCYGFNDGLVEVLAHGGSGTLLYNLDGGSWGSINQFPNLAPGTHTLGVTDGTPDTVYGTAVIIEPAPLSVNFEVAVLVGCAGNDGELVAHIQGGTKGTLSAYATEWTTMSNVLLNPFPANYDSFLVAIPEGYYGLKVEDFAGCIFRDTAYLPSLCLSPTDVSCFGYNNGYIDVFTTSPGIWSFGIDGGPMTFQGASNTFTFLNLAPGTHTVCMTDGVSTFCNTVDIYEPLPLEAYFDYFETVSCQGNDGLLSLLITGGTATLQPFLTTWVDVNNTLLNPLDNFATSISGLSVGGYTVTIEDDLGCFLTVDTVLGSTPPIIVNPVYSPIVCHGGTTMVNATATGGAYNPTSFAINSIPLPAAFSAGTYTIEAVDSRACTGTTVITITDPAAISTTLNQFACNAYTWALPGGNGNTYTMSGQYSQMRTSALGCDSLVTLNLNIGYDSVFNATQFACNSYVWNSTTYTSTGNYSYTTTNTTGCTNTYNLALTVAYDSVINSSHFACNSYTWNNTTYTTTGNYSYTTANASGCTNTYNLNLTIGYDSVFQATQFACDSYVWNNTTYTATGNYSYGATNATGCTNTYNLNLTVGYNSTMTNSATACGSYTWNANTYTASGQYSYTELNNTGCVNTHVLNLTINSNPVVSIILSNGANIDCNNPSTVMTTNYPFDAHLWTQNGAYFATAPNPLLYDFGQYYVVQSPVYAVTVTDANGCTGTSSVTVNYNFNRTSDTTTIAVCDTYTWPQNQGTYTASGNYPATDIDPLTGCAHDHLLMLTIKQSTSSSIAHTAILSYTWYGNTYTASGAYTHTLAGGNAAGCDSVITLNLTIIPYVPTPIVIDSVYIDQPIACYGYNDGMIGVAAHGGTSIYLYNLNGGAWGAMSTFDNLGPGTYTIGVTDGSVDTVYGTVTLIEPLPLAVTFEVGVIAGCAGQTGELIAHISGGTLGPLPAYATEWTNMANVLLNPLPNNYDSVLVNIETGNYNLHIEDYRGCYLNATTYLPDLCLFVDQHISCFGYNDGTVQASTGAPGSWSYGIDGGAMNNNSGLFLNLTPGFHTICMTDGATTYCREVEILEPLPLAATFIIDAAVSCHGNDGQISVNITGGVDSLQPFLTTWTDVNNTLLNPLDNFATTISGLSVGGYTVMIEDNNGCFLTVDTTVGYSPALAVTAIASPIACYGQTTVINGNATGGDGPYTYAIGTTALPAGFPAGTYTVVATDSRLCTATTVITLTEPALNATTVYQTACDAYTWAGGSGQTYTVSGNYTHTVMAANGCDSVVTLALTINYQTSSTTNVYAGNAYTWFGTTYTSTGSYTHTIVGGNANGCDSNLTLNLNILPLTLFVDQHVSCFGYNDGTVQVSTPVLPNPGPWMFGVDGGPLNNAAGFFLNLTPGLHTFCATDGSHTWCDTVSIYEPLPLTANFTIDATVSCQGNDGQISVNIYGGVDSLQPFLTTWTDVNNTLLNPFDNFATTVSGLSVGGYTVMIEDNNGCFLTVDTTLGNSPALSVTGSATPIACYGLTSLINGNATGGDGPYTYAIGTTALPASFPAGTYTIVATDSRLCTATTSITISQPALIDTNIYVTACDAYFWSPGPEITLTASGTYQDVRMAVNGCDSIINLHLTINNSTSSTTTVYAGNAYTWFGTTYTATGIYTYTLVGGNANGCDSNLTLDLNILPLTLFVDQHVSCYGYNDGTVQVSTPVLPNPGPWMFGVDGGPLNNAAGFFLNLTPGVHTFCATDGSHTWCDTVSIFEPLPLTANFTIDATVSCQGNDGQISVNIYGGVDSLQPYLTTWTDVNNTLLNPSDNFATTVSGLSVGGYTVMIEDNNGCFLTVDTTLGNSPALSVTATATTIACYGQTSTINALALGGDGPYTYAIGATALPANFPAGTYTVVATDSRLCTATTVITITQPALNAVTVYQNSCNSYTWTNGTGLTYTVSGNYTYTVPGANGCDSVTTLALTIRYQSFSSTTVYAGNAYAWYGTTYTSTGVYTHTLVGGNAVGCDSNLTLNLNILPLTLFVDQHVSCYGYNDGTVQASTTAIPNPGPWMFGVDGGPMNNATGFFLNLTPGVHTFCATDGTNTWCDTVSIFEPLPLTANFTIDATVSCLGNDGQLSVNIYGGVDSLQPYLTTWTDINNTLLNPFDNFATTVSGLSAGTYSVMIEDNNGCFLTVDTTLGLTPALTVTASATTIPCYGGVATISATSVNGNPPATFAIGTTALPASFPAGTYTVTGTDMLGCTGTTVITLVQPPFLPTVQTASNCVSYTWPLNNQTYTASGVYTQSFTSVNGCDSSYQLNLTILPATASSSSQTVCDSYTWSCNSQTYTTSGIYTCTYPNQYGCVHTETLNLTVNYSTSGTTTAVACDSYNWSCNGATYTNSGVYTCTYMNTAGCVHTQTLNLTVNYSTSGSSAVVACDSYTWSCNGATYTQSGVYTCTYLNASGCVHTQTLNLTINYSTSGSTQAVACDSYIWSCNNQTYTTSGIYTCTYLNPAGCVHTQTLNLTVNYSSQSVATVTNCNAYTWTCNGVTYTNSGVYTCTYMNTSGCLHTATLNLTIHYNTSSVQNVTAPNSYTWSANGVTYTASGTYTHTLQNANGCDSSLTLNLNILNLSVIVDQHISCYGNNDGSVQSAATGGSGNFTYDIDGANLFTNTTGNFTGLTPGVHTVCAKETPSNVVVCATIYLNEPAPLSAYFVIDSTVSCLGNDGQISIYISGGTDTIQPYLTTWIDANNTVLNPVDNFATTLTGLSVGGYTVVVEDNSGCFLTVDTVLGLTPAVTVSATHTAILCYGATSVITPSTSGGTGTISTTISGGSFTVVAGTYTVTATDQKGCTATTVVTITQPALLAYTQSATACDSYTWPVNGQVYTTSGTYTASYTSVNGCDSAYTLNLTVNYSTTGSTTLTVCDAYTWSCNGATYTTSGTYTCTYLNTAGCVHTQTLNLTVNYSTSGSTTAVACDSYNWSCNGATYTASGVYTCTYMNTSGCVHTQTLNLTVNYSTSGTTTAVACDSYTWTCNGATYTTSGVYTCTYLNTAGCVHTQTLSLTVNYSSTSTASATACDKYTWSADNQTYTVSGTYTATSINASGCLHTSTLNLLVNYSTSSVASVTAANSYTWNANNATYTASGTYTATLFNGNQYGCDSTLTLNLTILNINVVVDQNISCNGNNDGSAQATASGGSGNFTYDIDGANVYTNTTGFFMGLTPGTHTICAKESPSNVVVCGTVTITQPNPLSVVLTVDSTVSCLGNDGQLTAIISGGTNILQPYLTTWSAPAAPASIYATTVTGLTPGVYTVTVEDDNLCFATATVTLGLTTPLSVTASNTPILCYGNQSVITPTIVGGTGTITTTITGGLYTVTPGSYTIQVTDAKGCTATTQVTVTQPALLAYSQSAHACDSYTWPVNGQVYTTTGIYSASYTSVNGCDSAYTLNLVVDYTTASVETVTAANSYTWIATNTTYTASGIYTTTFFGGNAGGCDSNLTLNLTILNLSVVVDQNVSCNGNNDGSVQATGSGGTGNFTYDVDGANTYTNSSGFLAGLSAGVHTICAKESPSNVVVCATVTITQPNPLVVTLTVDSTVSCLGNDGKISATVSGGTNLLQPYLTTWSGGIPSSIYATTVNGLAAGVYTVTVEDDNLCFASATITLGLTPALAVTASSSPIICNGGVSTVSASASGGTGNVTYTINGGIFNVVAGTYTVTATDQKGCIATTSITITQPAIITGSETVVAAGSYTWPANNVTYTLTGTYTATLVSVQGCDSVATLYLTISGITIAPKLFLAGPYVDADGMMHDSLRVKGLIPGNEPYSAPPYNRPSINDNVMAEKMVSPAVLAVTGPNAIVDWVFVELRDGNNPQTIVATKRALVQRDGDVVSSVDGTSPLYFAQNAPGNYFVSVKHRNHLGIMTANALPLAFAATNIDYTTLAPVYVHVAFPPITNAPRKTSGAVSLMWPCDANANKNVKYNGTANDKQDVLVAVGISTPNATVSGYRREDVNLDGIVRYNNADNDKNIILNTVGVATPNNVLYQHTPN